MAEEEIWRVVLVAEEGKVWIGLAGEMLLAIGVVVRGGKLTSGSCCGSSRHGFGRSQRRLGSDELAVSGLQGMLRIVSEFETGGWVEKVEMGMERGLERRGLREGV